MTWPLHLVRTCVRWEIPLQCSGESTALTSLDCKRSHMFNEFFFFFFLPTEYSKLTHIWSLKTWNERADRDLCIYLLGVQYWLHHNSQFWWTGIDWLEVSDEKLAESERKLGTEQVIRGEWHQYPEFVMLYLTQPSYTTEENQSFYYHYWSRESFPGGASGKES